MIKPKLLIAGGGYSEIPLIEAAKAMGFFVITTGYFAKELGHKHSDLYEAADFSNKEQILELAKKHSISAICAGCNDFSAITSSYVAEKMGLPGHDTFENCLTIHHKDRFRAFCIENNLTVPKAKGFSSQTEAIESIKKFEFPVIIKPIDLTGGKGISIIRNNEEWESAIKKAFDISRAKKVVIEVFIEGTGHGFSALIQNGKVAFYFTDDEYYQPNEFWVSGTSTPGSISEGEIEQLIQFSEKTVSLLNLCDGLFHIQCIIKNGKVYIIEVCRRPPGDLYLKFIEHATGFNYAKSIIEVITGKIENPIQQTNPNGFYARHCISSLRKGYITDLILDKPILSNVINEFRLWKPDYYVENYVAQKSTILFMKFKTGEEMKEISNNLYNNLHFEIIN